MNALPVTQLAIQPTRPASTGRGVLLKKLARLRPHPAAVICRVAGAEHDDYALSAVYVRLEQLTVSPLATVSPFVMFMSDADAATAQ